MDYSVVLGFNQIKSVLYSPIYIYPQTILNRNSVLEWMDPEMHHRCLSSRSIEIEVRTDGVVSAVPHL